MSLEERMGYTFKEPGLLRLAMTHRSVSSENPSQSDNERLEFLGDAVLQVVITEILYHRFPDLAEGQLAKIRAAVVARPALADVARTLRLGAEIALASGEERTGGRDKDSIIADATEAVLGAVYLDGGIESARAVVEPLWSDRIADRAKKPGVKEYKTRLQEILAKEGRRPDYLVVGEGPDHARRFEASVSVDGKLLGKGVGRSKKEAEQAAASKAIERL